MTVPVHFVGVIDPEYVFSMTIPMRSKDTTAVRPASQLYMGFNRKDTTTITYELQYGKELSPRDEIYLEAVQGSIQLFAA